MTHTTPKLTPLQKTLASQLAILESEPKNLLAWRIAARAMADMGQFADAVAAQREALALAPKSPDLWVELGALLGRQGQRDEPETCFRTAVALDPFHHEARVRLGHVRLKRADLDEAGTCFTHVLQQKPNHSGAVAGAALVLDRRGHTSDAWTLLQRAPCSPTTPLAMAAAIVAQHAGVPAKALKVVRAQRRHANANDRALLLHAEGDLYDALGDPERAWRCWSMANQERKLPFDSESHDRAVHSIINLTREVPQPTGPKDERPVFIVGMPRSGTTLVESILDAHPLIYGAGELEAIRDLAVALPREMGHGRTYLEHVAELGAWGPALGTAYLELLDSLAPEARRVVDKMPNNALHLAIVSVALPHARIIWCERNDDDVALSCFQKSLSPGLAWATSIEGIRTWQRGLRALKAHWEATLPQPIMTVRYEDVVSQPEVEAKRLAAFVGLPFDSAMLDFHRARRQVATASWDQVTEGIHQRSVGRAEPYRQFLTC